jgi:hypothetical protein
MLPSGFRKCLVHNVKELEVLLLCTLSLCSSFRAGGVAQVVDGLPSKHEGPGFNPQYCKNKIVREV